MSQHYSTGEMVARVKFTGLFAFDNGYQIIKHYANKNNHR